MAGDDRSFVSAFLNLTVANCWGLQDNKYDIGHNIERIYRFHYTFSLHTHTTFSAV